MRPALLLALAIAPTSLAAQNGRAALIARIDSVVQAEMTRTKTPGMSVAVERRGELILAKGYGLANVELSVPATAETVYRIGSITKQFTSAGIMQLVEAGKVSLTDEITKFLPGYPTQGHKVTVHHLLNHTSGIKSYTSLGPKFWNEAARLELADSQLVNLFKNEPFDFAPGDRWLYNNSGYYLLGMIIEAASGQPYRQYLRERLLDPHGLRNTSYCDERPIIPHRAQGYEVRNGNLENDDAIGMNTPGAAGAMCSTVLDLLAWTRALHAREVVNAASLRRMTTPVPLNSGAPITYGYGLGAGRLEGHRSIGHGGGINGFITQLAHYPDDGVTVAVLGNLGGAPSGRVAQLVARLVLGIDLPRVQDLPSTAEERNRLAGRYDSGQGILTVSVQGDALMLAVPGQGPQRLRSQGDGRWVPMNQAEWVITFTPATGAVQEMVVNAGDATIRAKRVP